MAKKYALVNRACQRLRFFLWIPGALPQASMDIAPLALNRSRHTGRAYNCA